MSAKSVEAKEGERGVLLTNRVEVLDLSNREIQEGHAISNLDHRLGSNATHRGS